MLVLIVKLLSSTSVVEIIWAVGGIRVIECGHGRVSVGHLKHILVIGRGIASLDALVAGKLRCDCINHLRGEATMSIISTIISDEVRLFKLLLHGQLLLHLHLLLNFVHFSGES